MGSITPARETLTRTCKELRASNLITDLVLEEHQGPVLDLLDPARATFNQTTAHLLQARWSVENGWGTPTMSKKEKIALEPTASVLHYATETFEGIKAYRGFDGKLRLFRPHLNCERMLCSNARVSLPSFDPKELLALITKFLAIECPRWLPQPGSNLYVRPAMIGSGAAMGLYAPPEALFFLFAAMIPQPSKGVHPGLRLLATDPKEEVRAWPGGFGSAKVGASYGPAQMAQTKAKEKGCSQVLWLFGEENVVTEAGGSNFFIIWRRKNSSQLELVTASLDQGLVLPGITRRSVLELARERFPDLSIVERVFSIDEIAEAHAEHRLVEAFVSGTVPVSMIRYGDVDINFPMATTANGHQILDTQFSSSIKQWMEDIMYGNEEHDWAYIIDE